MTRRHRSLHRALWPVLGLAVGLGFALALWLRPPPELGQVGAIPRTVPLEQPA